MAGTALTRNLKDGQLTINDGAGHGLTLTLDEGDLSWTINAATREVSDRGTLDHTRPGDDQPIDLSYSAKWIQLMDFSQSTSGGSPVLYEILVDHNSSFTSTSGTGEEYTVQHVFVVSDPNTTNSYDETITFQKCFKTSVQCSEGDSFNTISYSGRDFETKPIITRT